MTHQRIMIIKTLYSGLVSVELPLTYENLKNYEVGELYNFKDKYNSYYHKAIIKRVKICPEYDSGKIFIITELL